MRSLSLLTAILCLIPAPVLAQVTQPSFEVATIKPSDLNVERTMTGVFATTDGIQAASAPISLLIRMAYGILQFPVDDRISGLPDWAKSQSFDIQAKLSDADLEAFGKLPSREREKAIYPLLQPLLAERFNLQFHRGSRQSACYELVVAKGGPKIQPITGDDPSIPKGPDGKQFNGIVMFLKNAGVFKQMTMAGLANTLTQSFTAVGRPVVDKTTLSGIYTFTIHANVNPFAATDPDSPSVFSAIQEDLGLKLQPSTCTLSTLIIDHLDHPTAN